MSEDRGGAARSVLALSDSTVHHYVKNVDGPSITLTLRNQAERTLHAETEVGHAVDEAVTPDLRAFLADLP